MEMMLHQPKWFNDPPSEAQVIYIRGMATQLGINIQLPSNKKDACEQIKWMKEKTDALREEKKQRLQALNRNGYFRRWRPQETVVPKETGWDSATNNTEEEEPFF